MECEYKVIKAEHPTAGSCWYVAYCKKYNQLCFKQCKKDTKSKK